MPHAKRPLNFLKCHSSRKHWPFNKVSVWENAAFWVLFNEISLKRPSCLRARINYPCQGESRELQKYYIKVRVENCKNNIWRWESRIAKDFIKLRKRLYQSESRELRNKLYQGERIENWKKLYQGGSRELQKYYINVRADTLLKDYITMNVENLQKEYMSRDMRFPTMWHVRPAKAQTSLRIRTVWSEPLLVTWIFYEH